ncbi:MAG: M15 family metallopeptidase, partial [Streptococcaceae bacterium]|nr:M15 family metallopeptidase [Streptococcaceae bacterium]
MTSKNRQRQSKLKAGKRWYFRALIGGVAIVVIVAAFLITQPLANHKQTNKSLSISNKKEIKATSTEEVTTPSYPAGHLTDWNLVLVNPTHPVSDVIPNIVDSKDGYQVLDKIASSVDELFNAAQNVGIQLQMVSGYRSVAQQTANIAANIKQNMADGLSEADATKETMSVMTEPGYSEHHTGLAIDVVDRTYFQNHYDNLLVQDYANEASAIWLKENAPKYGFILRYPQGKEAITKINFEPWHYRYVGVEHAEYI